MLTDLTLLPILIGMVAGLLALGLGLYLSRRIVRGSRAAAKALLVDARAEAESRERELLVAAQEKILGLQEDADRRERELDEREAAVEQRLRKADQTASELGRERKRVERMKTRTEDLEKAAQRAEEEASSAREKARQDLERVAGLTADEARRELIQGIEDEARASAARLVLRSRASIARASSTAGSSIAR